MGSGFHFEEGIPLFTIEGTDIPIILALMLAALAVEIFLAEKKDGRLGLVLPGLWLLHTLVRLVVRIIQVSSWSSVFTMGKALCLALAVENIPTLLLLGVYALCRMRMRWRTKQQLDKTRIDDL